MGIEKSCHAAAPTWHANCRCSDLAARHQLVNVLRVPVSRWLMQEEYNDTEFILVPAKEAVRPAEDDALYYLHRGAHSRGYKLERERERSSQVPRCARGD